MCAQFAINYVYIVSNCLGVQMKEKCKYITHVLRLDHLDTVHASMVPLPTPATSDTHSLIMHMVNGGVVAIVTITLAVLSVMLVLGVRAWHRKRKPPSLQQCARLKSVTFRI